MRRGFSLVELSIVLVILGLLVGGVLSGQSLIRAAELRSISTEYNNYITATHSFRDKYFGLPGDITNATNFWGRLNTNADCVTNSGAAVNAAGGTCDGFGVGGVSGVNPPLAVGKSGETFQFWRQLALAGLISGNYTGVSVGAETLRGYPSVNVPASRVHNAAWGARSYGTYPGDTVVYAGNYGTILTFGAPSPYDDSPNEPVLTPQEAWEMDTKMDDGKPGTGMMIARYWNNSCATASSNTDYASPYNLANTQVACSFYFASALDD